MTTPRTAARNLGVGFICHDADDRPGALRAFETVDAFLFPDADAAASAAAYVDALWAKDDLEESDRDVLTEDHWSDVTDHLEDRADEAGIDGRYASHTARAWRLHKVDGQYWTPLLRAQTFVVRAAVGDPDYPTKDRGGQGGPGPLPVLYLFGVELHDVLDLHGEPDADAVRYGIEVLTSYFTRIQELRD